jgi:peptidyl-prolyl cis-trans isomerase B (cyclophilin B)
MFSFQNYTMNFRTFSFFMFIIVLSGCARPVANFVYNGPGEAPAEVKFENQSKDATSYFWDFGDGNTSQEVNPINIFSSSGEYTVSLIAQKGKKTNKMEKNIFVEAPVPCLVEMTTPFGVMVIQLSDETPLHRDNFVKLVEEGFYDSLLFHRVIRGFMIQGGDPNSRGAGPDVRLGSGGPGYQIPAEFRSGLVHTKGALSAARMSDGVNPEKKSSGSQFYIVQGNKNSDSTLDKVESSKSFRYTTAQREAYKEVGGTPHLDQDYTVFGHVIEGLDIIDKIAAVVTLPGDRPKEDVWMTMRVIK